MDKKHYLKCHVWDLSREFVRTQGLGETGPEMLETVAVAWAPWNCRNVFSGSRFGMPALHALKGAIFPKVLNPPQKVGAVMAFLIVPLKFKVWKISSHFKKFNLVLMC